MVDTILILFSYLIIGVTCYQIGRTLECRANEKKLKQYQYLRVSGTPVFYSAAGVRSEQESPAVEEETHGI